MNRTMAGAGAVLLLTGCVTVNTSLLTDAYKANPVPGIDVHVFFADDSVPDHERVAILYAEGSDDFTDQAEMIDELRKEAGKLGANAIILKNLKEPGTGERVASVVFGISSERRGEAIAIYAPSLDRRREEGDS